MLPFQQPVQQRGAGLAVAAKGRQAPFDDVSGAGKVGECALKFGRLAVGRCRRVAIVFNEIEQGLPGLGFRCVRRLHQRAHQIAVPLRIDRQFMIEIPGSKTAALGIVFELDFASLQRIAVRPAQDRQQHAGVAAVGKRIPVDIEETRVQRLRSPFQDVEPPRIVGVPDTHVIGYEIEDQAEVVRLERIGEPREGFIASELGIESFMIDDVIAMRAAGPCFQKGRGVDMRNAEALEIRRDGRRIVKAEILGQLDAVSRDRYRRRHQLSPIAA